MLFQIELVLGGIEFDLHDLMWQQKAATAMVGYFAAKPQL
jgi:hypothetical protein